MRRTAIIFLFVCGTVSAEAQDKESALGAQLARQERSRTTRLGLLDVDEYVQSMGQMLARQMPDARSDWKFVVIRDRAGCSVCEPLTLPGGYVFVPASLVLKAENEAEFAGMLAHSTAHVVKRHGLRQPSPGATAPVIFIGSATFGDDAYIPAALLKIRRQQDLEADRWAVSAMAAAGYDPHALISYIQRVQIDPVRISNLEIAVESVSALGTRSNSGTFHSLQEEVRTELARSPQTVIPSLNRPKH